MSEAVLRPVETAASPGVSPAEESLRLDGVRRRFRQGDAWLEVLRGVTLTLAPGQAMALVGPSGSGKSTLLQIAGLLEHPDGGEVYVAGRACGRLPDTQRTQIRREHLGFVYQFHHLLPEFSALENVMLPQMLAGSNRRRARERARQLLQTLGLAQREDHRPARLSGGEQQRVAIARAMATEPEILLMDEPFAALDAITRDVLQQELLRIWRATGPAVLFVTHDVREAVRLGQRVVLLSSRPGRVVQQWPADGVSESALVDQINARLREVIGSHGNGSG
jgi:lipoprotein-releasing system ATP-binding protein